MPHGEQPKIYSDGETVISVHAWLAVGSAVAVKYRCSWKSSCETTKGFALMLFVQIREDCWIPISGIMMEPLGLSLWCHHIFRLIHASPYYSDYILLLWFSTGLKCFSVSVSNTVWFDSGISPLTCSASGRQRAACLIGQLIPGEHAG